MENNVCLDYLNQERSAFEDVGHDAEMVVPGSAADTDEDAAEAEAESEVEAAAAVEVDVDLER